MNANPHSTCVAHGPIRRMTMADLDAVIAVERQAQRFPWSLGMFAGSLAAGHDGFVLQHGADGGILGFYVAMPVVDEMHLLDLVVAPQQQGRGLARRLLTHLVRTSQARGARTLWLEVRAGNARARRLYERWGFAAAGLRRGYYAAADDGPREDAVVMRWALPDPPAAAQAQDALD